MWLSMKQMALLTSFFGAISFICGVIAENKKVKGTDDRNSSVFELSCLTALSPLNGRYWNKVKDLAPYMSEYGLIRYHVIVEIKWLSMLSQIPDSIGEEEDPPYHGNPAGRDPSRWVLVNEKATLHDILKEPNLVIPGIPGTTSEDPSMDTFVIEQGQIL